MLTAHEASRPCGQHCCGVWARTLGLAPNLDEGAASELMHTADDDDRGGGDGRGHGGDSGDGNSEQQTSTTVRAVKRNDRQWREGEEEKERTREREGKRQMRGLLRRRPVKGNTQLIVRSAVAARN